MAASVPTAVNDAVDSLLQGGLTAAEISQIALAREAEAAKQAAFALLPATPDGFNGETVQTLSSAMDALVALPAMKLHDAAVAVATAIKAGDVEGTWKTSAIAIGVMIAATETWIPKS